LRRKQKEEEGDNFRLKKRDTILSNSRGELYSAGKGTLTLRGKKES